MPKSLMLFADHTVRRSKNPFVLSYLANLASKFNLRLTSFMCLQKSQILARCIASCYKLFTLRGAGRVGETRAASLGTTGPQQQAPDRSGHYQTSTASARSQWALPDLNSKR